jgi:hypothetical protein
VDPRRSLLTAALGFIQLEPRAPELRLLHLLVVVLLLASVASASAEGAWVLWSRIADVTQDDRWLDWTNAGSVFPTYAKCRKKLRQYTGVPEAGSLADWFEWVRGTGRYDKRGGVVITASGVLLVDPAPGSRIASEWRCLPDTIDPRGPKTK